MTRKTTIGMIFVFAVTVAVLLLPAPAQAQGQCTEFRAVGQATLPTPHPMLPSDTWGGNVYGSLGGEFLPGIFSGNDGEPSEHGVPGMGRNGSYTFLFRTGSFKIEVGHAAWPFPPGKVGLGDYRGTAKIVEGEGTGRFQFAWGNLQWSGPFIVWPDQSSPFGVQGRFNAEIKGSICGVQPAP